jgi:hypothetical protein
MSDYKAGYRGDQFHHGMDRVEYERGMAQRENEDAIGKMAGGGRPVEVPGVAFTLILIAPLMFMIYPVVGLTIWAVFGACLFIFYLMNNAIWGFVVGFILSVLSFYPGMILERKASQFTVYRWFRNFMRFGVPAMFALVGVQGNDPSDMQFYLRAMEPSAITAGICVGVIAMFIYPRLDLLYFPALAEIQKVQKTLEKGERPRRSMLKRVFFGFCWLVPAVVVLTVIEGVAIRLFMNAIDGRELFERLRPVFAAANIAIWFVLFLLGKLPGTGKYMFSQQREADLMQMGPR